MGGDIVFASIGTDSRLRAAASLVGSPKWALPYPDSPYHHPHRVFPVALLSQTADSTSTFLPVRSGSFTPNWKRRTPRAPEMSRYVEYPGIGHFLTPEINDESRRLLVTWFKRWLSP